MKKLFTFLSRANNNSVGNVFVKPNNQSQASLSYGVARKGRMKSNSLNNRRVSSIYSMLTIMAIMLMVPSSVRGQSVDWLNADQTFDFQSYANQGLSIAYGDDYTGFSGNSPKYMQLSDGNNLASRFATPSSNGRNWFLRNNKDPHGLWGYSNLAICGLWNGNRVRITVAQGSIKFVEANSAKMNGSLVTEGQEASGTVVFAAAKDGDVVISTNGSSSNYTVITKIEIFNTDNGHNGDWTVSFNPSSVSLAGGQTYNTNNANVTPNWVTPTFTSSNNRIATVDENGVVTAHRKGTATITAKMDVGPEGNEWSHHATAELTVNVTSNEPVDPKYSYDPAIEIYDLSGINTGSASLAEETPGYKLNGNEAHYLANPSSYSLNNRLAVSQTDFTWANGLKTNLSNNQWRILAINGLVAGDRVVITYSGTTMEFGSNSNDQVFSAAGIVFKDDNNNGEREDDEPYLQGGNQVESGMIYTMEQDGHLDIRVPGGAVITKIEIYGDHQATMEDRYNGSAATGYTAYFSQTGQLLAKEHIVPGGLEVHIGNETEEQHAIVVSSDQGPVSFVYDQGHYKMARQEYNGTNITERVPVTGTFYKFMPEVDGYMTVRFKAYNIKYNDYHNQNGTSEGNEVVITSGTCPYYIMVKDVNNNFGRYQHPNGDTEWGHDHSTGENGGFTNIRVTAGNTYYVYGWWAKDSQGRQPGTEGWNLYDSYCGVAELIDVTFIPDNMVTPLAKWVASGTTTDTELADVTGYTTSDLHIKKMSDNITSCEPYIYETTVDGQTVKKLGIRNITFADGANPGGTILIKFGSPSNDANPVFAYTIAYDASWKSSNWTDNSRSEGHTWDFSTNPLRGLKWDNSDNLFKVVDFGKEAGPGLLYDEMHETNPDGSAHSDWTKTWRVINVSGVGTHDLMFLNKYDMEGDNADMMWDTEGIIINTASNQSCINNEFGGVVDHSKEGTRNDPDRYVGILPGGSFTIPALKAGDRVCIFMGSGDGSGANACKFNITGALDAIGQTISSTDIYNAGGSPWEYNMGNKSQYRGAYQFISTGGDMTFTMNGGSMTKLYSITIYTGIKSATNDATKVNYDLTYNDDEYIGANNTYWHYNDYRTVTPARSAYTMHYRGKGERLRKPAPVVLYKSGDINTDKDHLMYAEVGDNNAPVVLFKSEKEQHGMFRMRLDDLELNNKYVADYGLQNVTVGYLEKKNYPYTWDFTDLMDYADTSTRIQKERTNVGNYNPRTVDTNKAYEIEFMNNSIGEDVKAVEQWKEYDEDEDEGIPAGYGLQVKNEPYNGGVMWYSGQLYAGDGLLNEASFLSIKVPEYIDDKGKIQPDVNQNYNGGVRICDEGLCLTGGNWTITLPQVGTIASVYVRAKQVGNKDIYAAVGDVLNNNSFTYEGTANDGTEDKIYAVKGTGEDMKLMFNNLIIKKIAISQDPKKVNHLGYATESRNVEIDPELMGYMTGTGLKAYTVTEVTYGDKAGDIPSIKLTPIPKENVMGDAVDGDHRGYIIYNTDPAVKAPEGTAATAMDAEGKTKAVSILDGGFHLFVPDMHDRNGVSGSKKSNLDVENGNNFLRSCYSGGSIPQFEVIDGVNYTNYLMNYKYSDQYGSHEGPEAFYRASSGASLGNNKAYLQLLTEKVRPTGASFSKSFAIIFEDEFNGINPGITTVIDNASLNEIVNENNVEWYNLNGQKLNGMPSSRGLYIINGKKVVVK